MATKEIYMQNGVSSEEVPKPNPLGKAPKHTYRDPANRGRIAARKVRNGRLSNNPYQKGTVKNKQWQDAFDSHR